MRSVVLVTTVVLLAAAPAVHAQTSREIDLSRHFEGYHGCFVMLDVKRDTISRFNPIQCAKPLSPCSTFKAPNSLIGLETGVIRDADHVFKWDGRKRWRESLNRDHDLRSAIQHSVVWYYQQLAAEVGEPRMREALRKLDYGNRDISAGLTTFWLGSSLKISADQQVRFLRDLQAGRLPFSERSQRIVREIMVQEKRGEAVLCGKTGTGGSWEKGIADLGWFVGWVERGADVFVFALNIEADDKASGQTAREICFAVLDQIGTWRAPGASTAD
jgi:beta-lactamase class D